MNRKEKPIIFSGPMVRAILSGNKTQTRRVIKKKYDNTDLVMRTDKYGTRLIERQNDAPEDISYTTPEGTTITRRHMVAVRDVEPPYRRGDVLWVRETWQSFFPEDVTQYHQQGPRSRTGIPAEIAKGHYMHYYYRADGEVIDHPKHGRALWSPSIHMPREAARIFLKVTNVRAELLQDISSYDAMCEGMEVDIFRDEYDPTELFRETWDSINAKRGYGWDRNPWVWVIAFERIGNPLKGGLNAGADAAHQEVLRSAT